MIAFVIWTVVAIIFLIIGVVSWNSKEPVGFFTGVEPPTIAVDNIENYNRAVAKLWYAFAAILEVLGIPLLFSEQNSPVFIISILGTVFLIIGSTVFYLRIEKRYKIF